MAASTDESVHPRLADEELSGIASPKMRVREDALEAARVVGRLLAEGVANDIRSLLLDDLLWKARYLPAEARNAILLDAIRALTSPDIRRRLDALEPLAGLMNRSTVDVALLTVVPVELRAAKQLLEIPDSRRESRNINGMRFWEIETDLGEVRSIVLTMVGEARNLPCAIACQQLFNTYEVNACILVGIAAGLRGKVRKGDVIAPDEILDYEYVRQEPEVERQRPVSYSLDVPIGRDLQHFNPGESWRRSLEAALSRVPAEEKPGDELAPFVPRIHHPAVILSGEKLIADGSLGHLRDRYHDRVRGAEMEGAGFARICREYRVPWVVFRGVSDYGELADKESNAWQLPAALAAVSAALEYIKTTHRVRREIDSKETR